MIRKKKNKKPIGANPGYASAQIAKALTTVREHKDAAVRRRAGEKVSRWKTVLGNILTGAVDYGARTPVETVPGWATLEVVTGGFATGELLAGGPLQDHEIKRLEKIPGVAEGVQRRSLNAYFLTDVGFSELRDRLRTGCYDVSVPEEGALMVAAWLVENGYPEQARKLIDTISPYFEQLRFYPIPLERPRKSDTRIHLQTVGETIEKLRAIKPNSRILAQKEAVAVWLPIYDRIVGLFLETVENDWPCQTYPDGWPDRAEAVIDAYAKLRKTHTRCSKMEQSKNHSAQLLKFLKRCARQPDRLTGREVGRIRLILNRYQQKRGTPGSTASEAKRRRQTADVSAPLFNAIAAVVAPRLANHPADGGVDEISHLEQTVTEAESARHTIPAGTRIPPSIRRKVKRCQNKTMDALVEEGLITSGETLARVLPRITSEIQSSGIADPALRRLHAKIYRAFRCRRSLLLLNLEKQIQVEELPWFAAIDQFRSDRQSSQHLARQALEEITLLTLSAFPYAIIPNKLVQELHALVKRADLDMPLVEELAVDIFMGKFSSKYTAAALRAADLLKGSLYAAYYGIDGIEQIRPQKNDAKPKQKRFRRNKMATTDEFARLCAQRAGVRLGTWDPATNGMVVEQQQILTTQNLAVLFDSLGLAVKLEGQLEEMARHCFQWICKCQQVKADSRHARLIMLKNTAYAWRQMIFFLSMAPAGVVPAFLQWAKTHFNTQKPDFRRRFHPFLKGLMLAAEDLDKNSAIGKKSDARIFLGWSK